MGKVLEGSSYIGNPTCMIMKSGESMRKISFLPSLLLALLLWQATPTNAQVPLGVRSARGLTVTPAYEGWYENADGTYSISFGYFNRNFEEFVDIPVGPDNSIEPQEFNGDQPAHFAPRRHWGVFAIKVPADFGDQRVRWTLNVNGQTFSIPGHLDPDWQIDALAGEAGAGNTPPVLQFSEDGLEGAGPAGVTGPPLNTAVGNPLTVTVWAHDDGARSSSVASAGRNAAPVDLMWFKHQGPGDVEFSEVEAEVQSAGGSASTTVTFSMPGEYILRVRANDASGVTGAGHAQCCWTNGFVPVTVSN